MGYIFHFMVILGPLEVKGAGQYVVVTASQKMFSTQNIIRIFSRFKTVRSDYLLLDELCLFYNIWRQNVLSEEKTKSPLS